jgi:hypothetical protein
MDDYNMINRKKTIYLVKFTLKLKSFFGLLLKKILIDS